MRKAGDFTKDHISMKRMAEFANIPVRTLQENVKYLKDMIKNHDMY